MEQKKTLWIALSAGVFLLVVLGAALVIYSPGARANNSAIAMRDNGLIYTASLPPQSSSQGAVIATGIEPSTSVSGTYSPASTTDDALLKTDNVTVFADTANVYAKDSVSTSPSSAASSSSVSYNVGTSSASSSNVTARNEKGELAIKETGNQKKVEEPKSTGTASGAATEKAKTTTTDKSSSATVAKATASTTVKSSSGKSSSGSSSSSKSTITTAAHYWVQVASYSTKDNADEARKVLDAKDLPCEVFTFTKDSKLYYRVRVGPYKTESEAEKWKKSVDAIEMFRTAQSYVVDSSARASR